MQVPKVFTVVIFRRKYKLFCDRNVCEERLAWVLLSLSVT